MFGCPITGDVANTSNAGAPINEEGVDDKPIAEDGKIVIEEDGDSSESGKFLRHREHAFWHVIV